VTPNHCGKQSDVVAIAEIQQCLRIFALGCCGIFRELLVDRFSHFHANRRIPHLNPNVWSVLMGQGDRKFDPISSCQRR
jgi:hypothetical protein